VPVSEKFDKTFTHTFSTHPMKKLHLLKPVKEAFFVPKAAINTTLP